MNWIFQKTGKINLYKEHLHIGTQPIRVITPMIVYMFQNTHPLFFSELLEEIEKGKLSKKLNLVFGEEPIMMDSGILRTPRVNLDNREIELHETFLSYLWCCINATYVLYLETIDFPRVNKINKAITHQISQANINKAYEIFDYAKSLVVVFSDWDKNHLLNPELYDAEKRDPVEQTNIFYTEALKFILTHEYTHLKIHVDKINEATLDSHYLDFEYEADNNAIDTMRKGFFSKNHLAAEGQNLAVQIGIVFGVISMFYFRASTVGKRHPNAEDRLTNALERLELSTDHEAWGIACVGLEMWNKQFNLNLVWLENYKSYKELYYSLVQQIKNQNIGI